jgi:hypothetical protein
MSLGDETCQIHQSPMIKEKQHTGNGNWEWSKPFCPTCNLLKASGKFVEYLTALKRDGDDKMKAAATAALASIESEADTQKEPAAAHPVIGTDAAH